jgi:hypothetical protein
LVRWVAHASPSLLFSNNNNNNEKKRKQLFFFFSQNQKEITGGIIIGTTDLRAVARNVIQSWNYFNGIFFFKFKRKKIFYMVYQLSLRSVILFFLVIHSIPIGYNFLCSFLKLVLSYLLRTNITNMNHVFVKE